MTTVLPVSIESASGDTFTMNQTGTINLLLITPDDFNLPPLTITLKNALYVPKLNTNLLSIGRMTCAGFTITLTSDSASLIINNITVCQGNNTGFLFNFCGSPNVKCIEPTQSTMTAKASSIKL
ncbi:hypothetical protein K439DRAFT_1617935 [Ramaria rubella]|nr:hypothetical protein K439DRAFT_1617935 [Ramaria rubella]